MSRLDQLYRSLILTRFFVKGWGNPEKLRRLLEFRKKISCRANSANLVPEDYPIYIDEEKTEKDCRILNGHFTSPFTVHLPGIMPKEVKTAKFQMILPTKWKGPLKPTCLHLAGTGDHGFWRRRMLLAKPLLKESGIASIILENPFYGERKPKNQRRSSLLNVSDLFVMGGALVLESMALFHWCEREGLGPLGITGISMGGHMASLAASNWKRPIALVPCLSWSTASSVFMQGVLSGSIPWKLLEEQFAKDQVYENELSKLVHSPEDISEWSTETPSFKLGQTFAKNFPSSLDDMLAFQKKHYVGTNDSIPENEFVSEYSKKSAKTKDTQKKESKGKKDVTKSKFESLGSSSYHTASSQTKSDQNYDEVVKHNEKEVKPEYQQTVNKTLILAEGILKKRQKQKQPPSLQVESLDFMRGIMDECTHLGNFEAPLDTSLVIIVVAKSDAYVPRQSVLSLEKLWPGSEVREINSGHIAAFVFKQAEFRKAITDAFDRQIKKYFSPVQ